MIDETTLTILATARTGGRGCQTADAKVCPPTTMHAPVTGMLRCPALGIAYKLGPLQQAREPTRITKQVSVVQHVAKLRWRNRLAHPDLARRHSVCLHAARPHQVCNVVHGRYDCTKGQDFFGAGGPYRVMLFTRACTRAVAFIFRRRRRRRRRRPATRLSTADQKQPCLYRSFNNVFAEDAATCATTGNGHR